LTEDSDKLVIDQRTALECRLFQPPNLLLDNDLESGRTNKQRWGRSRRIVQDGPDISILDLIKRIDSLDSIVEELVEYETDSSTSRKLIERKVVGVSVDCGTEFRGEFGNGGQDD
jgi:hypothetical protein